MKRWHVVLLITALAAFGAGLIQLFRLRFQTGDNYPPYSSLRADPLGTKALYESLDALVPTRRNLQPISRLTEGNETTLLRIGEQMPELRFSPSEFKNLERFVRTGGRLVLGAFPVPKRPLSSGFIPPGARRRGPVVVSTNAPPAPDDADLARRAISIKDRWDLSFDYADLPQIAVQPHVPALASLRVGDPSSPALPRSIRVHTALHFEKLGPEWHVIFARIERTNEYPVLIERSMGRGSIVLAADSFHFSNEALLNDRQPELLAWFIGPGRRVVWDETHLGVQEDPGVAALARQYRLHGLLIGLLVLAALFIWKNSVSFMPPREDQLARERGQVVEGKESAVGFINLLRRNIRPADMMKLCLEQWNAHAAGVRKPSPARLQAMQTIIDAENALEPRQRHPIETYQKFCEILKRRT
jgi:hypothetical protein